MKKERFDCKTARNIPVESVLSRIGLFPKRNLEKDAWYLSPFRSETKASFKVSKVLNRWYDHGEGRGGNVIDLVILLKNCTVSEALNFLKEESESFSFQQPKQSKRKETKNYEIVNIDKIKNPTLISYLQSRKIDVSLAKKYCKELHYSVGTSEAKSNSNVKTYYAIAFKNDLEGYEIRNKFFKGCLGKKSITTILNQSCTASLFESWSDFLSYLTLKSMIPDEDFIILNSTSLIKKTEKLLNRYHTLKVFFDNDAAGKNILDFVKNKANSNVLDCSVHYSSHEDLNEYLVNVKKRAV
ncbi:toprim domain-containing protein [Leeuwenhoekiella aequorea]|uniref:Toprim domain-containing protein n=1 Tax=Leeuwenhoekiella aequorea TaxID=283736 RepID=A0A4Q0P524_9FLAO|nr:toprim domain-containing protein [Leeuwenhoekiella aequorea]RXG21126.1 Toprim domain-containing protein [Leeuwenhoekiella aequorea]